MRRFGQNTRDVAGFVAMVEKEQVLDQVLGYVFYGL